jgi:hypothetical protein
MATDVLCCAKSCAKRSRYPTGRTVTQRGHWGTKLPRGASGDAKNLSTRLDASTPRKIRLLFSELSLV